MKFYYISKCSYPAVIWAGTEAEAIIKYCTDVCEEVKQMKISQMDVDDVLKRMTEAKSMDAELKTVGTIGILYRIINSRKPKIVIVGGTD